MRFRIVPEKSRVFIGARSTLHPINTSTHGVQGWLELTLDHDGAIDLTARPAGQLSFHVERLASGNPLQDREMRRLIDARRYPTIQGELVEMERAGPDGQYRVRGDLTFKGVTNRYEDDMTITHLDDRTLQLDGASTFDIRDFGMDPPRILMLKVEPTVNVRVELVAERDRS